MNKAKKNVLILCMLLMCLVSGVEAATVKVVSLDDFSTAEPKPSFKVQLVETKELKDGTIVEAGTIVAGSVIKIQNANRGKRDAYFEILPASVTYQDKTTYITNPNCKMKVVEYSPKDPQEIVESAAKGAVGFIFKGASQGISFVQGVAQAQEGERMKSGLTKMYKDSPLSYIEYGSELNIKTGDILMLKIKTLR